MEADDEQAAVAGSQGLGDQTGQGVPQAGPEMPEAEVSPEAEEGQDMEPKNYMFFSNLKVIKDKAEQILSMDPAQVDSLLEDGHDWAADHIATSKDDVEEVYNWLAGEVGQ